MVLDLICYYCSFTNNCAQVNQLLCLTIMSHFVYTRTTEPSISSYVDFKTGLNKFRFFVTFGDESKDDIMVHKLSKNYDTFKDAKRFGSILRDLLELKGNIKQIAAWDSCRTLSDTQLYNLVREFHKEKMSFIRSESTLLLLSKNSGVCYDEKYLDFEESERTLEWWEVNGDTFLLNKMVADDISASIKRNSEFAMISPKLFSNFLRRRKTDFFLNMSNYVDPLSGEAYFTFKIDLMSEIFTKDEIFACRNQFLSTMSDSSLNGVYMCEGMRKLLSQLPMC